MTSPREMKLELVLGFRSCKCEALKTVFIKVDMEKQRSVIIKLKFGSVGRKKKGKFLKCFRKYTQRPVLFG